MRFLWPDPKTDAISSFLHDVSLLILEFHDPRKKNFKIHENLRDFTVRFSFYLWIMILSNEGKKKKHEK